MTNGRCACNRYPAALRPAHVLSVLDPAVKGRPCPTKPSFADHRLLTQISNTCGAKTAETEHRLACRLHGVLNAEQNDSALAAVSKDVLLAACPTPV